jgi:CarD family transcriptional regulator
MKYKIGSQVIHWNHGPGTIVAIDEKCLAGQSRRYYVVDTGNLTLWVPIDEAGENSIRMPTDSFEFKGLLSILRSPGESLPERHFDRKSHLVERMQKRKIVNICCVIRDLYARSHLHNLNENDKSVLRRAEDYLLDEWELSLGTARSSASRELEVLLRDTFAV